MGLKRFMGLGGSSCCGGSGWARRRRLAVWGYGVVRWELSGVGA